MKKNGFTIIELMITVAIAAIVLAFGVPSFIETIKNGRLTAQANALTGTLNFARSEAIKSDQNDVVVCGSSDQASCNTSNWESGWIVFVDVNGDNALDGSDQLLRVQEPLGGGNTLRTSGFVPAGRLVFSSRGMVENTGSFRLCDDRGASHGIGVVLNISGQARKATDETANGTVNLHEESDLTCP